MGGDFLAQLGEGAAEILEEVEGFLLEWVALVDIEGVGAAADIFGSDGG